MDQTNLTLETLLQQMPFSSCMRLNQSLG